MQTLGFSYLSLGNTPSRICMQIFKIKALQKDAMHLIYNTLQPHYCFLNLARQLLANLRICFLPCSSQSFVKCNGRDERGRGLNCNFYDWP